jgi:murein DD-endopeptidase MepM/ murein hydrolase activator NlpD
MAKTAKRTTRRKHLYDVAVVSLGHSKKTLNFRISRLKIILLLTLGFGVSVAITLAVLIYTPLAMYVPIPNPGLEARYGRQIVETQQRLNFLAEEMLMLKGYNIQLRRALGDEADSARQAESRAMHQQSEPDPATLNPTPWGDEMVPETQSSVIAYASSRTEDAIPLFPLQRPTDGFVTQGFDPSRNHFGIDFAAKRGTAVHAAADGRVVFAGWSYDDGNMIVLSHGSGYLTVYKHNQTLLAGTQTSVKRGELIALLGTSGRTSQGPHLHFEVWRNGRPADPNEYLITPSKIQ